MNVSGSLLAGAGIVVVLAAVLMAPFLLLTGSRPLTGRRILLVFVGLFGVIIAVNIYMAVTSVRSFPGVEVASSYVASQTFDRDRAAQEALGWTANPSYRDGRISILITDAQGRPAKVQDLRVTLTRPTQKRDDQSPEMVRNGGLWTGAAELAPGAWVVHLEADAPDGTVFRQRIAKYPGSWIQG